MIFNMTSKIQHIFFSSVFIKTFRNETKQIQSKKINLKTILQIYKYLSHIHTHTDTHTYTHTHLPTTHTHTTPHTHVHTPTPTHTHTHTHTRTHTHTDTHPPTTPHTHVHMYTHTHTHTHTHPHTHTHTQTLFCSVALTPLRASPRRMEVAVFRSFPVHGHGHAYIPT